MGALIANIMRIVCLCLLSTRANAMRSIVWLDDMETQNLTMDASVNMYKKAPCKCSGERDLDWRGGPACDSMWLRRAYCYTLPGVCSDGHASHQVQGQDYSFRACKANQAACECSGKTNQDGSGGPACNSTWLGKEYCYTLPGVCSDGISSQLMPGHHISYRACKAVNMEVAKLRSMEKNPVLYVPGFASTMLEAKPTAEERDLCKNNANLETGRIGKWKTWETTFITAGKLLNIPCLLYSTMLQYPKSAPLCPIDNPGFETRVMPGKKGARAVSVQPVAKYVFHYLKKAGYVYGESYDIVSHDWRKFSLPCYNQVLFKTVAKQIEKLSEDNGNAKVFVTGHSLGSMLLHRFLAAQPADWKNRYIQHFLSISAPFAGTPATLQVYMEGPHSLVPYHPAYSKFARATVNSWAGFLATIPNKLGGVTDEDFVFLQVASKNYTVKEIISGEFFKDHIAHHGRRRRRKLGRPEAATCAEGHQPKSNLSLHCCQCLDDCHVSTFGPATCRVGQCKARKWSLYYGYFYDYCVREGYAFDPNGDARLMEQAALWAKEYEFAPPPGVPTTCYGVSNIKTSTSWKYDSFADTRGVSIAHEFGDGTVTTASAIGPCKRWRELQMSASNESNIGYILQSLPGAEGKHDFHKEVLLDSDWLAIFIRMLRHARNSSLLPDASLYMASEAV